MPEPSSNGNPADAAASGTAAVVFERTVGGLAVRAVAGRGSDVLVVVPSQVRVPAGRFGLARLFARTRHACLFLNQPDNAWYRGTEAAVDAALAEAADRLKPARIVVWGSSMGAFAALAIGARHPAAEVFAFAPDFAIGEAGSRSAEAGLPRRPGEADAAAFLAARTGGATTIVSGLFDAYDAGVAARLHGLDLPAGVRLVALLSSHAVHDHLYSVNVVRKVIAGFTRDLAAEAAARGLLVASPAVARMADFAALAAAVRAGEPVDPAAVERLGAAGDPGVGHLLATVHEQRGEADAAAAALARLEGEIAASPVLSSLPTRTLKAVPRRRMALLAALGRAEEAEAVRRAAAVRFPNEPDFAAPT